jgi:hypothetical protein
MWSLFALKLFVTKKERKKEKRIKNITKKTDLHVVGGW